MAARKDDGGLATLGEGFHASYGGLHAERAALADCADRGADPAGATMLVSLEPCAHHGRQPPCVEAVLEAGISRLVIASGDPSPKASGNGPERLAAAGVEVIWASEAEGEGAGEARELARRARLLNQPFRKHQATGRPLVVWKAAVSLDGRVATRTGDSKWISSEASRSLGHRWRAELDAIAVGSGTALADDPELTARPEGGGEAHGRPVRVVLDSHARLGLDSRLMSSLDVAPVIVTVGPAANTRRVEALRAAGAEVIEAPGDRQNRVAIGPALDLLGSRPVTSLLLEGGPRLAGSFLEEGEIDEVRLVVAPLLLGSGPSAVDARGPEALAEALRGSIESTGAVGEDSLVVARMREW